MLVGSLCFWDVTKCRLCSKYVSPNIVSLFLSFFRIFTESPSLLRNTFLHPLAVLCTHLDAPQLPYRAKLVFRLVFDQLIYYVYIYPPAPLGPPGCEGRGGSRFKCPPVLSSVPPVPQVHPSNYPVHSGFGGPQNSLFFNVFVKSLLVLF